MLERLCVDVCRPLAAIAPQPLAASVHFQRHGHSFAGRPLTLATRALPRIRRHPIHWLAGPWGQPSQPAWPTWPCPLPASGGRQLLQQGSLGEAPASMGAGGDHWQHKGQCRACCWVWCSSSWAVGAVGQPASSCCSSNRPRCSSSSRHDELMAYAAGKQGHQGACSCLTARCSLGCVGCCCVAASKGVLPASSSSSSSRCCSRVASKLCCSQLHHQGTDHHSCEGWCRGTVRHWGSAVRCGQLYSAIVRQHPLQWGRPVRTVRCWPLLWPCEVCGGIYYQYTNVPWQCQPLQHA